MLSPELQATLQRAVVISVQESAIMRFLGNLGFTAVAPQYITGNALGLAPKNVVSVFDTVAPLARGWPCLARSRAMCSKGRDRSSPVT